MCTATGKTCQKPLGAMGAPIALPTKLTSWGRNSRNDNSTLDAIRAIAPFRALSKVQVKLVLSSATGFGVNGSGPCHRPLRNKMSAHLRWWQERETPSRSSVACRRVQRDAVERQQERVAWPALRQAVEAHRPDCLLLQLHWICKARSGMRAPFASPALRDMPREYQPLDIVDEKEQESARNPEQDQRHKNAHGIELSLRGEDLKAQAL